MRFNLWDIVAHTQAGTIKGVQREIACGCWFTSQGKSIPKLIKVMDEEGKLHIIDQVEVLYSEEKNYAGIPTVEHVCKLILGEREATVKLIYAKDSCRWTIVSGAAG
jgi:hypothetical protein